MKMKMKKLISGVLVALLSVSLTGCASHQKITKDDLKQAIQEMDTQDKKDLASMLKDTEGNNKEQQEVKQVKDNKKEQQEVKQIKESSKKVKCSICGAEEGEKIGIEYRSEFNEFMCEGCYYRTIDSKIKTEDKYCAICGSTKNLSSYGNTGWICENCKICEEQKYDEAGDYCY